MSFARLWSNVKCKAGALDLGPLRDVTDFSFRVARDGSGECSFGLKADSPMYAQLRTSRVVRIVDDASAVHQFRIRQTTFNRARPVVPVRAIEILHDLARVYCFQVIGGITSHRFSATKTPAQWRDEVILPSLAAKGYTWITAGTMSPVVPLTLTFQHQTTLWLAQQLGLGTPYLPWLEWFASAGVDAGYLLHVTDRGGAAPRPRLWVGQNVLVHERHIDAEPQATAIIPRGAVPSGGSEATDIGEYAMRIVTAPAAGTAVTVEDPDGNLPPIKFSDQEVGQYLELVVPHKRVFREDVTAEFFDAVQVKHVAYAITPNTLWISGANNFVYVYNAATRAYVGAVGVGNNCCGVVYAGTGNNKIYVMNPTADTIVVFNASTLATIATITLSGSDGPRYGVYVPSEDAVFVTCLTSNTVKRIACTTDTVAATISGFVDAEAICYAATPNRVYVVGPGTSNCYEVNPVTNAIAATIALGAAGKGVTWADSTDRVFVSRPSSNDVKVIRTSDGVIVATISGLTSPSWCYADPTAARVYVVHNTDRLAILKPSDNTLEDSVFVSGGMEQPGASIASQGVFVVPAFAGSRGWMITFVPATKGIAVRRAITASSAAAQTLTIGTVPPFAAGDLVSLRTDLAGGWRSELSVPSGIAADDYQAGLLDRSDLRGERNHVLNPWGVDIVDFNLLPHWDRTKPAGNVVTQIRWSNRDASAWVSFNAQADGAHSSGVNTVNLKGMTPGDMLLPGDWISTLGQHIATGALVDGAGKCSVGIYAAPTAVTLGDGATVTVLRPALGAITPLSSSAGLGVLPHNGQEADNEIGVNFPIPFVAGRTGLLCGVEVLVWPVAGFVPSTMLQFRVSSGGTLYGTVAPSDALTYADKVVRSFILTFPHTVPNTQMLSLRLRCLLQSTSFIFTCYFRRWWATFGPEADIQPPFAVNGSDGGLYAVSQLEAAARYQPRIAYKVSAKDDNPAAPFVLGGYTDFRDPPQGVADDPRIIAIRRRLAPNTQQFDVPEIEVDNREETILRRLVRSGAL